MVGVLTLTAALCAAGLREPGLCPAGLLLAGITLLCYLTAPVGYDVAHGALAVRFRPQRAGSWAGTLRIESNAVNAGDAVATLIGVGLGRVYMPMILREAAGPPAE